MKINVIATSGSEHLAGILKQNPDFCVHFLAKNKDNQRFFPDGEVYVNIGNLCAKKVVVLFSGAPKPSDSLLELEFLLSLLKERKIEPEIFVTYFPYSRQDSVFKEGEINAAEFLVKNWINCYGVKKIYVLDAHFKGRDWVKNYPIKNISAIELLKKAVFEKYPDIFFISPDGGEKIRSGLPGFSKQRKNSFEVELSCEKELENSIKNRVVGVIDDMIGTGGTMAKACQKCKELGAKKVVAISTHGVLQSGVDKIKKACDELFLTNTINCAGANVDASNLIMSCLKNN